jgi:hypothetical protein
MIRGPVSHDTRGGRGITVVELLVSAVLMFMLFYYIYKLLEPGLRVWRQSDVKVRLQQNNLVGMYRLINEVKETNRNSVVVRKCDPPQNKVKCLICFASARDNEGNMVTRKMTYGTTQIDTGEPAWQKFVIYYLDDQTRLRRYDSGVLGADSYTTLKENPGMRIATDPINRVNADDYRTNAVIARQIQTFDILYNPNEAEWKGLIVKLSALHPDPNPREQFSNSLETSVGVRYLEKE